MTLLLTQLEPEFLRWDRGPAHIRVATIGEANGICFICPKCYAANGRQRPGVHSIICWEPEIPKEISPGPGRWRLTGKSFDDLSLDASVQAEGGCNAHFHIQSGIVIGSGEHYG